MNLRRSLNRTESRRGFLKGLAGILAAGAAPAIITTPGLLMPVKKLWVPEQTIVLGQYDVSVIWTISNIQQYRREVSMDVLRSMTA